MTLPASRPSPPARSPWLLSFRAAARPRLRLICFPYAGGNAAAYRSWATAFPPDTEVLGVQLPGRGSRFKEPLSTQLAPMLDALASEVAKLGEEAPFAFFGHSMGALLAFELARELRGRGAPMPSHLFVSAHRAPGLPERDAPLHHLSDAEFLTALRRYGGMPVSVLEQPELMEMVLPIVRADFALVDTWREIPGAPLDLPITAFRGDDDASVSAEEVDAWRDHTRGAFALHTLPGDHFFIQSAEPALLDTVIRALSPAHRGTHPC
jgi:medium-chain acyl-[acyl-carrier-protein] hydrolase